MVALSIHSILAGVSIGIESSPEAIASTAIAILAHKSFEGFCLGSSLVSAQVKPMPFWILGVTFACATPLGIIIGQIAMHHFISPYSSTTSDDQHGNAVAIIQAIVAGTFLYIAIVEIGAKELLACRHTEREHGSSWQKQIDAAKLVCFVFGFLIMSALAFVD